MIAAAVRFLVWPFGIVVFSGISACFTTAAERQTLQIGELAPEFQATNQDGHPWKSMNYHRMRTVVVFFYAGDFRKECMRQIRNYQENLELLADINVVVVGISGDTPETHRKLTVLHKCKVTLLSDFDGTLAGLFGVPIRKGGQARVKGLDGHEVFPAGSNRRSLTVRRGVTAENWTFIIGRDGTVIYKKRNTCPAKDTHQVLEFIQDPKSAQDS